MDDLGEIVLIEADALRKDIESAGFTMREVTDVLKGIYLNSDYVSHRIKKGSMPEKVLKAVCEVINKKYTDYIVQFDLSEVSSWQMKQELKSRGVK